MKTRHLFLFGGSPPFGSKLGRKFADITLKNNGKVGILFIERTGWKEYMQKYTCVLVENNLENFVFLPLSPTPLNSDLEELISCSGIIISGGETELYRNFIVDTPIGNIIKVMYKNSVPVAGFSAGALISPKNCVIPPIDNAEKKHLFLNGLGLIEDCVISVHFSRWKEDENIKAALLKTKVPIGYGIDDDAGVYFENETLTETEGEKIYTYKQEKITSS